MKNIKSPGGRKKTGDKRRWRWFGSTHRKSHEALVSSKREIEEKTSQVTQRFTKEEAGLMKMIDKANSPVNVC